MRVRRTVWRHVPAGAEPLHLGWILRARGRWNLQRPRVACLYTAFSRAGALAEYDKLAMEAAFARQPRDLVSIRAPSAAAPGEMNLMVYPASSTGRLALVNGDERLPINYGAALRL